MKMLQSLSGKLNRLTDVREIGMTIADELRALFDYHNCRVSLVDGDTVVPIAFRGELAAPGIVTIDALRIKVGEGVTGHVVATGKPILSGDAANCEYGRPIPGTESIDESLLAVPLRYGSRSIGSIVISKFGFDQFDNDDLRLLEVLAGHAAVALENARLYEVQRREAERAKAALEFAGDLAAARGLKDVLARTVAQAAHLVATDRASIWLEDQGDGRFTLRASHGYEGDGPADAAELGDELRVVVIGHEAPLVLDFHGQGYVVSPLVLDDGTSGCVVVAVDGTDAEQLEQPMFLLGNLASHAKLAVANANKLETLERMLVSTVEALEAGDAKSHADARDLAGAALRTGACDFDQPVAGALERLRDGA
jgi:GAF domain-containing protein